MMNIADVVGVVKLLTLATVEIAVDTRLMSENDHGIADAPPPTHLTLPTKTLAPNTNEAEDEGDAIGSANAASGDTVANKTMPTIGIVERNQAIRVDLHTLRRHTQHHQLVYHHLLLEVRQSTIPQVIMEFPMASMFHILVLPLWDILGLHL